MAQSTTARSVKEALNNALGDFTVALENDGSGNPIFVGLAPAGTAKSATGWKIKKLTYSGTALTDVQWPDAETDFNKIWDDRATYTYS